MTRKVVLCAVDDSPRAAPVLQAAMRLADCLPATLHVYRAVAIPIDIPAAAANPPSLIGARVRARTALELSTLVGGRPDVVIEEPEISAAPPWQLILQCAERLQATLIVIGSHGYGGVDRLLGTTAAKLVNHARCNVLVARSPVL